MNLRSSLALAVSVAPWLVAFAGCSPVTEDEPTARVRIAHLSPDAPAVDVCLAPAGTSAFRGPILSAAGALAGVAYGHVTTYVHVAPDAYDVRIVAPGSTSCATGLVPDITGVPALPDGGAVTLVATGNLAHGAAAPFELRAYVDDLEPLADQAKLRFIHASPGTPNVDVGIGGGIAFAPVFGNVAYGATIAHDDGYVKTAPVDGIELSARATGTTRDVIAVKPVGLAAGSITTAFAIGELGNAATPLRVLVCNDAAAAHATETECALAGDEPERARVRIAHLSPDAPAVDLCIAPAGGAYGAPVLATLGARQGLAYPQVTTYVELPIASFDLRVIAATETTCANPAVPDTTNVAVAPGLTATIAAIGDLDRSGAAIADPGFRLAVFPDATAVDPALAKLRFIHASPGTPNVDVGIYNASHVFVRLFGNVEFGKIAVHGGIDPLGYLEATPLTATVSARVTGSASDALVIPSVTLAPGTISTAIAIGNKTGAPANPLRVLWCADTAPADGLLARCAIAQ